MNHGCCYRVGRCLQIENSRVDLRVVPHTRMYRGRLLTSRTPGSVASLQFPRRRDVRSASHSHPEHIEVPKRGIPPSLICCTFQSDLIKDEVKATTGESSDSLLKCRVEVYKPTPTSNHSFMYRNTLRIGDHFGRQHPEKQVDPEEEPRSIEHRLELPSQGCLACTRTTVEDEDSTRLQVALHTPKDARKSQDRVGLKPAFGGR